MRISANVLLSLASNAAFLVVSLSMLPPLYASKESESCLICFFHASGRLVPPPSFANRRIRVKKKRESWIIGVLFSLEQNNKDAKQNETRTLIDISLLLISLSKAPTDLGYSESHSKVYSII